MHLTDPMTPTTLVPMTVNIGSHQNQMNVNMQPSQLRMMGTTGPLVQMFGNNVGNRQPQALSRPGSGLSQPSVSSSQNLIYPLDECVFYSSKVTCLSC